MRLPIRLTLVFGLIFAVSSLIAGALVPLPAPSTSTSNSPYFSALSEMAVPSAEAIPCYTYCYRANSTDPWQCINCFPCNTACHKFGTNQCENLTTTQQQCPTP
ncbi:MAG TPA: hypothetical protein VK123_11670 [Candidatus Limnocylindrales bacterium]|nr:hypothetical protein [Candidatus Limnocylindrales bacterium]